MLQILFSILAMLVVMWHSRRREFRADAFAARMMGAEPMIRALQKIDAIARQALPQEEPEVALAPTDQLATMKIFGRSGGFSSLFASHPPIEARITALRQLG